MCSSDLEVGDAKPDVTKAKHVFWRVVREERTQHTATVVETLGSTMVFTRTRHGADRLAKQLARVGVKAAAIHGGRSQAQRDRALKDFSSGAVKALVATDVAARGVHVDDVAAVVHFDAPADAATYVHRSGRTARASASGVVVSLVESGETNAVVAMQRKVGIDAKVEAVSVEHLRAPKASTVKASTVKASAAKPVATTANAPALAAPKQAPAPKVAGKATAPGTAGTIKFFNHARGFGFITHAKGDDLFVHISNIDMPSNGKLLDGQPVHFEIGQGRRGDEALSVRLA